MNFAGPFFVKLFCVIRNKCLTLQSEKQSQQKKNKQISQTIRTFFERIRQNHLKTHKTDKQFASLQNGFDELLKWQKMWTGGRKAGRGGIQHRNGVRRSFFWVKGPHSWDGGGSAARQQPCKTEPRQLQLPPLPPPGSERAEDCTKPNSRYSLAKKRTTSDHTKHSQFSIVLPYQMNKFQNYWISSERVVSIWGVWYWGPKYTVLISTLYFRAKQEF